MTMNKAMYSSKKQDWETPIELFKELDNEFHFTLDACATKENAKVSNFISPEQNALISDWSGIVFCNPPYGRKIKDWVRKGFMESRKGSLVVMLLPARTDTDFFHTYCIHQEVRFLKGRIRFSNSKSSAPFPSMIVIFRQSETLKITIIDNSNTKQFSLKDMMK